MMLSYIHRAPKPNDVHLVYAVEEGIETWHRAIRLFYELYKQTKICQFYQVVHALCYEPQSHDAYGTSVEY